VTAPPDSLLCRVSDRDEAEYVINTRGLDIKLAQDHAKRDTAESAA
jgi:hypothetical protein